MRTPPNLSDGVRRRRFCSRTAATLPFIVWFAYVRVTRTNLGDVHPTDSAALVASLLTCAIPLAFYPATLAQRVGLVLLYGVGLFCPLVLFANFVSFASY